MRLLVVAGLLACKSPKNEPPPSPKPVTHDAGIVTAIDARVDWPELAGYPRADATRTVVIPTNDNPRFDVGGPVLANELAIISSSQFGFAAIDYRRGQIAWTKPAGLHVAPPLLHGTSIVLVGECYRMPQIENGEALLGCLRVVTTTGSDEAYIAIRGEPDKVEAFANEKGPQSLWNAGERAVRWRRGEQAVTIDLMSGIAKPASAEPPSISISYKGTRYDINQRDGRIVATGKKPWETEQPYPAIVGVIETPDFAPRLRLVKQSVHAGEPEVNLFDMDATGSLHASFARPAPGIALLGHGMGDDDDTALAVRIDNSLQRDYVVGYMASAMLVYVHPLPVRKRTENVGVAVAEDAVVVFHDGDQLTILPDPGSWQNPTP